MKHAALIVLFCVSRFLSQTGPPALRCLEVQPNGDVILHWLPATDQGSSFERYEAFTAITKNGPYSKAVTTSPVNTPSVVHTATTALVQTAYYFVRTVRKDSTLSETSDTLNTIFLNIIPGDPALKLFYNHIKQPPPPSASSFTITREYPIPTVNTLTITNNTTHLDVISVCSAKMNYQVLQRNAGCISKSNTIFGDYKDTKSPDTTYVDSISVLPDGRTILSWSPNFDMDVDSYYVIKKQPLSNQYVDALKGRQNTTYIFNSTEANDQSVALFVQAVDSCSKRGTFDERPTTIFLETFYEYCNYRTRLEWNGYQAMKKGIKHYKVYCSIDGAPFFVIGNTTGTSFVHDSVPPKKQICYFVRVVNGDESITASSNRVCFFSRQVDIPSFNYLIHANVNRAQQVEVRVKVDDATQFTTLDLQRSESGGNYTGVQTLPFNGGSHYDFVDTEAETSRTPYYYRIVLRDSCGNARSISNVSRTVHLRVSADRNKLFERQLFWTSYEGYEGGLAGYNIYRIVNEEMNPLPIAFAPAGVNVYTDELSETAPEGSAIAYRVEAVEHPGNTFGEKGFSGSNMVSVYVEGRLFIPNAFCPNGTNKTWKPISHFVDKVDYRVWVFDRWGHEVFYANDQDSAWDGANCPTGAYVYLVEYRNGRGEYLQQKGSVLLLR